MTTDGPKVSVILPVYNVEPYIGRCVESLQAQTLANLEFIFVDDCSTDGSMAAVEDWAEQDERVRILRNESNLGSGPSRNRGIEEATGIYLSFIDADDYVATDFYELLWQAAETHNFPEIIKGSRVFVQEDAVGSSKSKSSGLNKRIRKDMHSGVPLWFNFSYEHHPAIYLRKAVSRSGARYGTSRVAQDNTFLLRFCSAGAHNLILEDAAIYYYTVREGSAVRNHSTTILDYRLHAFREQMDCLVDLAAADPQTTLRYASRAIGYPLAPMGLSIRRLTGDGAAAQRFFEGLRQQVLRLPGIKDIDSTSVVIQALVEHGIPLAAQPYAPSGEPPHVADWPPIVAEWFRFCSEVSHSRIHAQVRAVLLIKGVLFDLTTRNRLVGNDVDFEQALASIREITASYRARVWLLRIDPQLALFAAGGPVIIFALKRRAKSLAKRILRR